MRKLDRPTYDAEQAFLRCISRIRAVDLKQRLIRVKDVVASAAKSYEQAATNAELFMLAPKEDVAGIVTKEEMEAVYSNRMAGQKGPGRAIYEQLLNSPPYGICPLCSHRSVTTLDHYLPKTSFPVLAVVPCNLVPACSDCNKAKLNYTAHCAEDQTLHPYFDDIEEDQWLYAEVVSRPATALHFYVEPPAYWDSVKAARVHQHFRVLKLSSLYASQAGNELVNIQYRISKLSETGGIDMVRRHLQSEADSRIAANRNSWQSAMYTALAASRWYCERGFKCI